MITRILQRITFLRLLDSLHNGNTFADITSTCKSRLYDSLYDIGYIDVGDGCWRQNVLVTVLAILVATILYLLT